MENLKLALYLLFLIYAATVAILALNKNGNGFDIISLILIFINAIIFFTFIQCEGSGSYGLIIPVLILLFTTPVIFILSIFSLMNAIGSKKKEE